MSELNSLFRQFIFAEPKRPSYKRPKGPVPPAVRPRGPVPPLPVPPLPVPPLPAVRPRGSPPARLPSHASGAAKVAAGDPVPQGPALTVVPVPRLVRQANDNGGGGGGGGTKKQRAPPTCKNCGGPHRRSSRKCKNRKEYLAEKTQKQNESKSGESGNPIEQIKEYAKNSTEQILSSKSAKTSNAGGSSSSSSSSNAPPSAFNTNRESSSSSSDAFGGSRRSGRSNAGRRDTLLDSVGQRARIHTRGDGGAAPTEYIIESINETSVSVRKPASKNFFDLLRTDEFLEPDDNDNLVIDSFEVLDEEEVEQEDVKRWQVILDRFRSFGNPSKPIEEGKEVNDGRGFSSMDDAELVELLENLTVTLPSDEGEPVKQHWNPESFRKEAEDKGEDPDIYLGNSDGALAYQDLWCIALAVQILQVGYIFAYSWDDGDEYYDVRVVLNDPQEQRVRFTLASGPDVTNQVIGAQVAVYQIVDGEEDTLLGVGTLVEYNADTGDYKVVRFNKKPLVKPKKTTTELRRVYDDFILAIDTFRLTDNTVGVNITAAEIEEEEEEERAAAETDEELSAEDDDQIDGHYVWFKDRIFYAEATQIPYTYRLVEHLRNGSSRAPRVSVERLDANIMLADADAYIINEDGVSDVYETNGELIMVMQDGKTLTKTQYDEWKAGREDSLKNLKAQAQQESDGLLPSKTPVYVDGDVETLDGTIVNVSNVEGKTQGNARLVQFDKSDDYDSEAEEDDDETYKYTIQLNNDQVIRLDNGQVIRSDNDQVIIVIATADQVSENSWESNNDDDNMDVVLSDDDGSDDNLSDDDSL